VFGRRVPVDVVGSRTQVLPHRLNELLPGRHHADVIHGQLHDLGYEIGVEVCRSAR
jgi:hypothetical protein